ncbi:MAG: FlgD immunoglobulin-like domain containing protein, partial [Bacteroidota bacterium]
TWQRVVLPPDGRSSITPAETLDFDLAPTGGRLGLRGNLNHRVFSVTVDSDTMVWVGTAGGINRSTDGGASWMRFSHENQANGISGNFVVAIREQRWAGQKTVWAATVNAESGDERRGVSWSTDNGASWRTALLGEFAHNFAFRDSIVYVATDAGLYRSSDGGTSWLLSGSVVDPLSYQRFVAPEVIAAAERRDTVWIGGPDGLALTEDAPGGAFGSRWQIIRSALSVAPAVEMYVYPNPFSPAVEAARVHYAVPASGGAITIRIFDIALQPVRDLLVQASRPSGQHDEVWDGRTDEGRPAANGVYFIRIEVGKAEPVWGKVLVLQ